MPVTAQIPFVEYTATAGQTTFPYPFYVIDADDLYVYIDDDLQLTGYSTTGIGNQSGGSVVLDTPLAGGESVKLQRKVPQERETDYLNGGDLDAEVLDRDIDRVVMMVQDLAATIVDGAPLVINIDNTTTTDTLLSTYNTWNEAQKIDISHSAVTDAYGWISVIKRTSGSAWVLPIAGHGHAMNGGGGVIAGQYEAWTGDQAAAGTGSVKLVGLGSTVISQYSVNASELIGLDLTYSNRPVDKAAPFGGLGSNKYNLNSKAINVQSLARSANNEYCGWNRGVYFSSGSLDSSTSGKAIAVDMSALSYSNVDCIKFPDGTILNSATAGGGAVCFRGTVSTYSRVFSDVPLTIPLSAVTNKGGGTFSSNTYTIPVTGTYRLSLMVAVAPQGGSVTIILYPYIRRNGSTAVTDNLTSVVHDHTVSAGRDTSATVTGLLDFVAGDTVQGGIYAAFTGAGTVWLSSNPAAPCHFALELIG